MRCSHHHIAVSFPQFPKLLSPKRPTEKGHCELLSKEKVRLGRKTDHVFRVLQKIHSTLVSHFLDLGYVPEMTMRCGSWASIAAQGQNVEEKPQ
jgi:hypothetical protein